MDGRQARDRAVAAAEPVLSALLSELVQTVPGAMMGCLSSVEPVRLSLHTDHRAAAIDADQIRAGTGPCVEVMRTRRATHADITQVRLCWPRFARAAREARVFSFLVVPIARSPRLSGALSLYGGHSHAFVDSDLATASSAMPGIRRRLLDIAHLR
ncbi:GAF domain-containing protein [Saccharopolyspora sp. NPDC000359]|uniref:GAF domain-containing protein n=1 Tax=Saccharopolyspora sp. NPDC000359 TaxID=3154251 RepID=UPI00331A2F34